MRSSIRFSFAIAIALLVAAVYLLAASLNLLNFDTNYAPGYNERNFDSITKGMTESEVIDLLGPPLTKVPIQVEERTPSMREVAVILIFSSQGADKTANYFERVVYLDSQSRVLRTAKTVYWD